MELKIWLRWTRWRLLKDVVVKDLNNAPASYIIAANREIHRAVGVDEHGILTIGKTGSLKRRIAQFKRSAGSKDEPIPGHMAGWRFSRHKMNNHFPYDDLRVRWRHFDTVDEAAFEESTLLTEYVRQHMEQPPLNYSASWRILGPEP